MTTVEIKLDNKSIERLKKVDDIHRDSIINIGLALVSKTNYFKTLSGEIDENNIEKVVSIDIKDIDKPEPETTKSTEVEVKKEKPKKVVSSWDGF